MSKYFILLCLLCFMSCTAPATDGPPETATLEQAFKALIVDANNKPVLFSGKGKQGEAAITFFPDGRFESASEVKLEGQWRFQQDQLQLYYAEQDRWVTVDFKILEEGGIELNKTRLLAQ